jgi:hypothetical protein
MINEKASLVQIPSGYKSGTLYSVVPNTSAGDFIVTRGSTATRVNKDGLIESVAADVPRLNYNPSNPQDPHLLLEPERTNIAQNSNELNTGWAHSQCTLTPNQAVAPDGSNTGSFVERTSTIQARVERGIDVTDQNYTWSCFVKKGNQRYAFISVFLVTSAVSVDTIFDFDTESIVFSSSAVIANSVVEYSNGWYRLTTTFDALASQTAFVKVGSTSSTTLFSTGNVGDTIYVWGAQVEAGSYPTSYIPTTIAVTRTVDTCKLENFTNAPSDYPFTVFCEMEIPKTGQKGFAFSFIDISTSTNYFMVGYNIDGGGNFFVFERRENNNIYNQKTSSTYEAGRYKIAVKFISSTQFKGFIDGVEVVDKTHTSLPFNSNINDFLLGQLRVSGDTGHRNSIDQFMVFNEALTDAELQTLTT